MKLVSFYSCCVVVNKKLSVFENIETLTSFCIYLHLSSIPLLWAQFLYLLCLYHLALFQGLLPLCSILHSPVIWYVQIPILHLSMACLYVAVWTFIPLLAPNTYVIVDKWLKVLLVENGFTECVKEQRLANMMKITQMDGFATNVYQIYKT